MARRNYFRISIWPIRKKRFDHGWLAHLVSSFATESTYSADINRVVGSIIVCASQDIGMLIVGRIINGLSVGVSIAVLSTSNCQELTIIRSVQPKFQFICQRSHLPANVVVSSVRNNGPLLGVLWSCSTYAMAAALLKVQALSEFHGVFKWLQLSSYSVVWRSCPNHHVGLQSMSVGRRQSMCSLLFTLMVTEMTSSSREKCKRSETRLSSIRKTQMSRGMSSSSRACSIVFTSLASHKYASHPF